jgi:hypothetical protein
MQNPKIIGRDELDDESERSSSTHLHEVSVPFEGGAVGTLHISVFRSLSTEDRGGLVIRVTLDDQASSFLPTAKSIPQGIEIHMAGDIEARSLVHALRTALATV